MVNRNCIECQYCKVEYFSGIDWTDGLSSPSGWFIRCPRTKMNKFIKSSDEKTRPTNCSLPTNKNCRYYDGGILGE